jgi:hypothetical protein
MEDVVTLIADVAPYGVLPLLVGEETPLILPGGVVGTLEVVE